MRDEGLFASSRRSPLEAFSFHRRRVRRVATVAVMLFLIPVVVLIGFMSNLPGPVQLGGFEAEGGVVGFAAAGSPAARDPRSLADGARMHAPRGSYKAGDAFLVPAGVVLTVKLGSPVRSEDAVLTLTGPAAFAIDPKATKTAFLARLDQGALAAEVSHRGPDDPFDIDTAEARVSILGTAFDLRASEGRTILRVRRGSVAFRARDALPGATVKVTPDMDAYVVEKGSAGPVPLIEGARPTSPPAAPAAAEPPLPQPPARDSHAAAPAAAESPPPPAPPAPGAAGSTSPPPKPGFDLDTPVSR
jgi:hypothetical protein